MHESPLSGQLLPKGSAFQYVCSEGCETAGQTIPLGQGSGHAQRKPSTMEMEEPSVLELRGREDREARSLPREPSLWHPLLWEARPLQSPVLPNTLDSPIHLAFYLPHPAV